MSQPRLPACVLVDESDRPEINKHFWELLKSRNTHKVYTTIKGKIVYLHRFLLNPPDDKPVDHKSGDGLDNRRENLRVCTSRENSYNKGPRTGLTYKGITKLPGGTYRARICVDGFRVGLGCFSTAEEAALAYNIAATRFHGEFARLNEIL